MELLKCALFVGLLVAARAADEPHIDILPKEKEVLKAKGDNFGLTCKAVVPNLDLLTNFRWLDPKGQVIDETYTKVNSRFVAQQSDIPGQLILAINKMSDNDVGRYTCTGEYNQKTLSDVKELKIYRPIEFVDASPEQSAKVGSTYKIKCEVKADPSPQVSWQRNRQKIDRNNPRYTFDIDGLTISGVQESDDGEYVCEVVVPDTGELKFQTINFEVISTPKVLGIVISSQNVIEGESANMKCNVTGKPKPTIQWILVKDGSVLQSNADGTLYFERIAKKDGGQYKCVASNKAGQDEKIIALNIVSKPEVVESVNATILVGQSGKLQCYVEGYPTPMIRIVKQGPHSQDLETNELASQTVVKEDPKKRPNTYLATTILKNVERSQDGLYECIAVNQVGDKRVKTVSNLHVTVEFQPTFEKTSYVKEAITWGTERAINLTCIAEAIPNASIEWFRGTTLNKVAPTSEYKIYGSGPRSDLEVTPRSRNVFGDYRCEATNTHGKATRTITLREAFPPKAIGSVEKVEVTASSVTFRFSDPMNTGGLPIKGYTVQYFTQGQDWNKATDYTWPYGGPYVLRNLKPLTTYTFRFRAINDAGAGEWGGFTDVQMPEISSPSEPVITNPLEPNEKYIKSPAATKIHLKWAIPSSNGADIDKYMVKFCAAQQDPNVLEGFSVSLDMCQTQEIPYNNYLSQYSIENLSPKSYYRIELTAHNNIGFSNPSQRFFLTNDNSEHQGEKMTYNGMSSAAIIYVVVAVMLVLAVIIDIFCYYSNNTGILYVICISCCGKKKKNDDKLGSESKDLISNGHKKIDIEEQSPMITDGSKKDTAVEYDMKKGTSKTGFVGKDSAV